MKLAKLYLVTEIHSEGIVLKESEITQTGFEVIKEAGSPLVIKYNRVISGNSTFDSLPDFEINSHRLFRFECVESNTLLSATLFTTPSLVDLLRMRYMIGDFPYKPCDGEITSVLHKLGNPGRKILADLLKPPS